MMWAGSSRITVASCSPNADEETIGAFDDSVVRVEWPEDVSWFSSKIIPSMASMAVAP
jgi:hypothetical protein